MHAARVLVALALLAAAGCGDDANTGDAVACVDLLAEGAPAPDVQECTNPSGEHVGLVLASWDCDDGRTLVAVENRWWFSDGAVHVEAETKDAPPADEYRKCRPS